MHPSRPDSELATSIAKALTTACPIGDAPSDEAARNTCAGNLTELAVLRDAMREPFIWGGQQPGIGYRLDMSTNKFNARVWRRMYLSTFKFGQDYSVEQVADSTVLHIPITFRGAMPAGAYPYPFWHSARTGSRRGSPRGWRELGDAIQIASGGEHSCALRRGGTVVCWGMNGGDDHREARRSRSRRARSFRSETRGDAASRLWTVQARQQVATPRRRACR